MDQSETKATTLPSSFAEEIKVTPIELAEMLNKNPEFQLQSGKKLIIQNIDTNDFLSAISAPDQTRRLQVFLKIMNKLSLDIILEGSIHLGEFNIGNHSWTLSPGESGFLKISSKPTVVVKSITEMVSFLSLIELGNGFPLKARQDLLLTGLSADAMLDYYNLCKETENGGSREKGQDILFQKACELLRLKNLNLKIYGLNAAQVDRNIDTNVGGILFKASSLNNETQPHLILTLLESK